MAVDASFKLRENTYILLFHHWFFISLLFLVCVNNYNFFFFWIPSNFCRLNLLIHFSNAKKNIFLIWTKSRMIFKTANLICCLISIIICYFICSDFIFEKCFVVLSVWSFTSKIWCVFDVFNLLQWWWIGCYLLHPKLYLWHMIVTYIQSRDDYGFETKHLQTVSIRLLKVYKTISLQ